ncbi:B3/4 domain-containing protein [Clostridium thailandense]|uniref:B3/B4 domain-containing protein n=1 Tax=Clostridium thailandense TaxID=2794346 RepID=UPI0039898E39
MVGINICDNMRDILGEKIVIGAIEAKIRVKESDELLWKEISSLCSKIEKENSLEDVLKIYNIKAARDAYKKLGKDPSRYRVSSESLVRRVTKGNELYRVNNIVDINNLISIYSFNPVCAYDIDKIDPEIYFTIGEEGDYYEGIGRGQVNLSNLPVFKDSQGEFGSTTSDSIRAMVTENTEKLLMNIVSFSGEGQMEKYMEYCKELIIKYAEAKDVSMRIIK